MTFTLKRKEQLIMLLIIALTLAFIFAQSAMSVDASNKESEAVSDAVGDVLGGGSSDSGEADGGNAFVDFFRTNIRKIAHFVEYAVLGAEAFVLLLFARDEKEKMRFKPVFKLSYYIAAIIPAVLIAFIDESIQIISKRGHSVVDMWIDIAGYFFAFSVLYVIFIFVKKQRT